MMRNFRCRRAQLQTLEPIIITITLVVLLLVGGSYFLRASNAAQERSANAAASAEDLALLERVTTLPEISCSGPSSANRLCVDLLKAGLFGTVLELNETLRIGYFPLLGASNVTLRVVSMEDGSVQEIQIYDASRNSTTVRSTRTYVTVLDPASGTIRFGSLEIRRSS